MAKIMNEENQEKGITKRSVAIGSCFCFLISLGEPYGVLVLNGSPMAADFSAGAALFLFFIITCLLNPFFSCLGLKPLGRKELATVYIMLIVASAIPSWGFTMNLIPLLGGFFYYATPENEWASVIQPHIPSWLVPESKSAIWNLFEGLPQGLSIPWNVWFGPLFAWTLFIISLYCVTICLLVILRKQWVERERLLFPLATLPLEMCNTDKNNVLAPFFRNRLMWLGFSIPAAINSLNAMSVFHPVLPRIDLSSSIYLWRNSIEFLCTPRFEVIGLSYLLSLDVSMGIWIFAIFSICAMGVERIIGWNIGPVQPFSDPATPSVAHIALGALFYLVAYTFWQSRSHLKDVFKKAVNLDDSIDDSDELLSYRGAFTGLIVFSALCLFWLWATGMNFITSVVFFVTAIVIFIGLARIISQTGLAYGRAPVAAPMFTVNTLGTGIIGPTGLTTLSLSFAWAADIRTFVMAQAATGLKLSEVTRLESRRLLGVILVAIGTTLCGSIIAVLQIAYGFGGINLSGWQFIGLPSFAGNWVSQNINNSQPIQFWHLGFTAIGSGIMAVLSMLKARFIGFPIHPIGLTLGFTHPIRNIWFSVFVAWLLKTIILKYGGATLYRQLRPFFLGLVLGTFGSAGFWLIISSITGVNGLIFTLG